MTTQLITRYLTRLALLALLGLALLYPPGPTRTLAEGDLLYPPGPTRTLTEGDPLFPPGPTRA